MFGTSPSSEMNEKFWDILSFCQQVSKLMVSEIRKRASNQSTEAASCAIAKFLEIENSEESSNGWMLLSTLNLLAAGDQSLIQVHYIFFSFSTFLIINTNSVTKILLDRCCLDKGATVRDEQYLFISSNF